MFCSVLKTLSFCCDYRISSGYSAVFSIIELLFTVDMENRYKGSNNLSFSTSNYLLSIVVAAGEMGITSRFQKIKLETSSSTYNVLPNDCCWLLTRSIKAQFQQQVRSGLGQKLCWEKLLRIKHSYWVEEANLNIACSASLLLSHVWNWHIKIVDHCHWGTQVLHNIK